MAAAVLLLATRADADDLKVGKATVTKNQVEGVLRSSPRSLSAGSDVFANELVRTGDGSLARLVFLDNTDLAVGPKSEIRLDRFVYDPNRGAGSVIVQMTRGAFRFVTGKQDSRNYTINTPYATLGVRGTVFEVVATTEKVDIHLVNGALTVRTLLNQEIELGGVRNTLSVLANGGVIGPFTTPPNNTILPFDVAALGAGDATGALGSTAGGGGGSLGGQTNTIAFGAGGVGSAGSTFPPPPRGAPTPFTPLSLTGIGGGGGFTPPSSVSQSVSP